MEFGVSIVLSSLFVCDFVCESAILPVKKTLTLVITFEWNDTFVSLPRLRGQ